MGATTNQIFANLQALGFSNTSAAAIYNKIAEALGIPVDNTIQELANSLAVITATISAKNYGKSGYYTDVAKAFQLGYDLTTDPVTQDLVYATIDTSPAVMIITQAAFEEVQSGNNVQLFLKVAATDPVTGNTIPLTAPQLAAFTSYMSNFEILGLPVSIISLAGNVLNFGATCTYFKTYDLDGLQTALAAALTTFRQTFAFDGIFYDGDLNDYIKANVPGIRNFFVFNTILDATAFAGDTTLPSGYFNYNPNLVPNLATLFTFNAVAA